MSAGGPSYDVGRPLIAMRAEAEGAFGAVGMMALTTELTDRVAFVTQLRYYWHIGTPLVTFEPGDGDFDATDVVETEPVEQAQRIVLASGFEIRL